MKMQKQQILPLALVAALFVIVPVTAEASETYSDYFRQLHTQIDMKDIDPGQAIMTDHNAGHNIDEDLFGTCYPALFQVDGAAHIKEYCAAFQPSKYGDLFVMNNDRKAYQMNDLLIVEAWRPFELMGIAQSFFLAVFDDDANIVTSAEVQVGQPENFLDDAIVAISLSQDLFKAGECYSSIGSYNLAGLTIEDEGIILDQFCIIDMQGTVPEPEIKTGIEGKVYQDTNDNGKLDQGEQGVSGMSVITVNLADFTDVNRITTDQNGDYSFELGSGVYLVQVEGVASPTAFAYLTVHENTVLIQNLGL